MSGSFHETYHAELKENDGSTKITASETTQWPTILLRTGSYTIDEDLQGNRNMLGLNFGINEFGAPEGVYIYKIVSLKDDKMILRMLGTDDVFTKI